MYPSDDAPHATVAAPVPTKDMAARLARDLGYSHLANGHGSGRTLREPFDRKRFHWKAGVALIPQFVANGTVLDIGAASGSRLLELRELGWTDLHGIELVPAAAARARAHGLDVICGSVEATLDAFADQSFDVIVTNMVLEHLANPFEVVRRVATKLRPGGQFLFSTITRDSLDAKLFGKYWCGFDLPRHLVYMRDRDIDDMVRDRFEVLGRYRHAAPQDFIRAATWRRHENRWIDRMILSAKSPLLQYRASLLIAWSGQSCRVSYRCRLKD
jgi:SAM-dependent methyltransferase